MSVFVNTLSRRVLLVGTVSLAAVTACRAQNSGARADLYACEGCEAANERPASSLDWDVDIAKGEPGEPLILEGHIVQSDGRTPAPGVTIYMHQTNRDGLYANGTNDSEWSRRHGKLRGWVRTSQDGRYRFRTIKPAPYPDMTMPAHIHLTIAESGRPPYYIDDVVFDGEFNVDADYRARQELRGGSGIVRLNSGNDGTGLAIRNIVLERHP